MYKKICPLAMAGVLGILLTACQPAQVPLGVSSDFSSNFAVSEAASEEEIVDSVSTGSEVIYPADQPPTLSSPAPDFLNEEQQLLYRRAHDLYGCFNLSSSGFDMRYPDPVGGVIDPPENLPQVEKGGYFYTQAYGRYKTWADFERLALSLFTRDFFEKLNSDPPQYVEQDGLLYHLYGDRGSNISRTNDPDTFELVSRTDSRIEFTVTGYYWDWEKYSDEELVNLPETDSWDSTQSFPIVLEQTAEGWLFSYFQYTY